MRVLCAVLLRASRSDTPRQDEMRHQKRAAEIRSPKTMKSGARLAIAVFSAMDHKVIDLGARRMDNSHATAQGPCA